MCSSDLLTRADGSVLAHAAQAQVGEAIAAQLADGSLDLRVAAVRLS